MERGNFQGETILLEFKFPPADFFFYLKSDRYLRRLRGTSNIRILAKIRCSLLSIHIYYYYQLHSSSSSSIISFPSIGEKESPILSFLRCFPRFFRFSFSMRAEFATISRSRNPRISRKRDVVRRCQRDGGHIIFWRLSPKTSALPLL